MKASKSSERSAAPGRSSAVNRARTRGLRQRDEQRLFNVAPPAS
jgi:hypothetical protein